MEETAWQKGRMIVSMKILYVITALGTGGAENLLTDICVQLIGRHEVTVAFLRDKRAYEGALKDAGVETVFIDFEKIGFLKTLSTLRKLIKEKNIEIVHTHLPAADTVGRLAGLMSKNVQVYSSLHNTEPWKLEKSLSSRILRLYDRFTVNHFKRSSMIAVSRAVKDFTVKTEKVRAGKIRVLYNFIHVGNPQKSNPDFTLDLPLENKYVMIVMARLHHTKAHALLLEAMEKLQSGGMDDLLLLVLGEGEERENLERYIKEHGLSDNVHFCGVQKNVYDYIKKSRLLVLPSKIEGFPITILEAHYCRTPVLGSDISSIREALHEGENGVLFRAGDAEDLAEKIKAIRRGEYDLDKQVENGLAFCMSLTREAHIEELISIYEERI